LVPFREAEMLKAVCNAFHALKVAFANEVGALCATLSIDGQSLMARFVQDRKLKHFPSLSASRAALWRFLPAERLRMLLQIAGRAGVDLPLLRSISPAMKRHLKRSIEAVPKTGRARIGLSAWPFKPGTDDLRESPIVLIAEHLIGKGFDLESGDMLLDVFAIRAVIKERLESPGSWIFSRNLSR